MNHSLHEKTAASVLLKLFIHFMSRNGFCQNNANLKQTDSQVSISSDEIFILEAVCVDQDYKMVCDVKQIAH